MVRIMGRICEFTIAPATGRRKISHFLRIPKHAHSGHAGVAAFEAWLAAPASDRAGGTRVDANTDVWTAWAAAVLRTMPDRERLRGRRIAIDLANGALAPAAAHR